VLLALALFGCNESKIPEDAIFFDVTVTNAPPEGHTGPSGDECHPELEEIPGYQETFTYALALEGSSATIYVGESVFASGTITGCDLTYSTVVIGEETDADGPIKWQLHGQASVDPAEGDACVDGDSDWDGTEYFEVVNSEEETLELGCKYYMFTSGGLVSGE
jgi:hypothetical protein